MIDCKITKNFIKELSRMCHSDTPGCSKCLLHMTAACKHLSCGEFITQFPDIAIDLVQNWSDKHPQKTIAQDFLEKYPNGQMQIDGTTPDLCAEKLGYKVGCAVSKFSCAKCWQTPLDEVIKDDN